MADIEQQQEKRHDLNMTLREIAKAEGISHQAVSEIIERALKKIKKKLKSKNIKQEDFL